MTEVIKNAPSFLEGGLRLTIGGRTICFCKECDQGCEFSEELLEVGDFPNIRHAIAAPPGRKIVAADYSQIELRLAAVFSGEPLWIKAYKEGGDIHLENAKAMYKNPNMTKETHKEERAKAKAVSFAQLFGGNEYTLVRNSAGKMSLEESKKHCSAYNKSVPVYIGWTKRVHINARRTGFVRTVLGRIRPLGQYYEQKLFGFANRSAVNTIIQGSAADIMRLSMLRVDAEIERRGWRDKALMLLSVHDELVFEVDDDLVEEFKLVIKERMEMEDLCKRLHWPIGMEIEPKVGRTYGSAEEITNPGVEDSVEGKKDMENEFNIIGWEQRAINVLRLHTGDDSVRLRTSNGVYELPGVSLEGVRKAFENGN